MNPASDVVVIGGGAVGSACARSLALAGLNVTLLQRAQTRGDSWLAAAGMLAAQVEAGPGDPIFEMGLAGRAFYTRHAGPLLESTGIDIGLVECGILELALSDADVVAANRKLAWQRGQGHLAEWLSPGDVAQAWPWLTPGHGAFWARGDGAIDPVRMVEAFRRDAERLGARLVIDAAVALDWSDDRVTGVIGKRNRYPARHVVVAAGAWSGRLAGLPRPLPVEPVRGQMAAFAWPRDAATTIAYGPHCYLLRRGDELLIGATMEHVGFASGVTPDGIAELQRRIASIYPALADATPRRAWAGLRPGTPDGLPIIGSEPRLAGLWYATGHGRNGILLAGITGELIAQLVTGEAEPAELAPMQVTRF